MSGTADIVLGVQWGDEGKGRVVDALAADYDIVARFGGGDNAGHTLLVGERRLALRIVPSGALQARPELFIGGGTVVGLDALADEIDTLARNGVDTTRIKVSDRAHVVFPYHAAADKADEARRGETALGTTGRGIGPAYADRAARFGITFGELRHSDGVAERLRRNLQVYATRTSFAANLDPYGSRSDVASPPPASSTTSEANRGTFDSGYTVDRMLARLPQVLPHVVDGFAYIHDAFAAGKRILIEGAQGTLLDIGYGTYPYVTSSHTIAGGACTGLGIGPTTIGCVIGVAKAYCTRVGAGPFPSELSDGTGTRIRQAGREFGTVTARPRRCGWFDAVAARYASRVNGLTGAIITKLDVLSGFERLAVVADYRIQAQSVDFTAAGEPGICPQLQWFDGWREDISQARRMSGLPYAARRYIAALETALNVPVLAVSVGAERGALAVA